MILQHQQSVKLETRRYLPRTAACSRLVCLCVYTKPPWIRGYGYCNVVCFRYTSHWSVGLVWSRSVEQYPFYTDTPRPRKRQTAWLGGDDVHCDMVRILCFVYDILYIVYASTVAVYLAAVQGTFPNTRAGPFTARSRLTSAAALRSLPAHGPGIVTSRFVLSHPGCIIALRRTRYHASVIIVIPVLLYIII